MNSSPFQLKVRLSGNITKVPVTSSRKHISCLLAFLVWNEGPFILENVLQDCQVLLEQRSTCPKEAVVLSQRQQGRPCLGIQDIQLSFSFAKLTFHTFFFCQDPTHSLQYPRIKEWFPVDMARGCLRAVIRREGNITSVMVSWRKLCQLGRYL